MNDLNGLWKIKSDDKVFQIKQTEDEHFSVLEIDTKKEFDCHLSLSDKNKGHILSSDPFWDNKLIFFKNDDLFSLSTQLSGQSWSFERV